MQLKRYKYLTFFIFAAVLFALNLNLNVSPALTGPLQTAIESGEILKNNTAKKAREYRDASFTSFYSGDLTESIGFTRKYLEFVPDDTEALLILSRSLFWTQNNESAFKSYEEYFNRGGKSDLSVLYEYALVLKAADLNDKALEAFGKAEKFLDTAESELAQGVYFNYSYSLLKCRKVQKSLELSKKIKNKFLKSDIYEMTGDYYYNDFMDVSGTEYFDAGSERVLRKKELNNLVLAADYYKKSLAANGTKEILNVKIADCLWELGNKKEAVKKLNGVCGKLKTPYAYARLSYFLKETDGTSESVLTKCLGLLDKFVECGGPEAEAAYEKAVIYDVMGNSGKIKENVIKIAETANGSEWFCGNAAKLIIKYGVLADDRIKLPGRGLFKEKFKAEYELLTAYNYLRTDSAKVLASLNNIIALKNTAVADYDVFVNAVTIFDKLNFWEKIKNWPLRIKIYDKMAEISAAHARKIISWLEKTAASEKDIKEKYRLIKRTAELLSSMNDNLGASKKILKCLELEKMNKTRNIEIYKIAFKYALASAEQKFINELAEKIYDSGEYEEAALKYLIYKNYWDGDRKLALNCLEKIRTNDKSSPLPALFDGHEAYRNQKYFKALDFYKKACESYEDKNYVLKIIDDTRKLVRKNLITAASYFADSTGNYKKTGVVEFKIPDDKFPLEINMQSESYMKNNILNGNIKLSNNSDKLKISASLKKRKITLSPSLNLYSLNRSFNSDMFKLWPALKILWINKTLSLSFESERKFITDTPLSVELGIFETKNKLEFYNEKSRFIQFGSYQNSKINDGNSRQSILAGAGVVRGNFTFKMYRSKDNISGSYNGTPEIFAYYFNRFEAYYAPDNSLIDGIIVDFNRKSAKKGYRFSLNAGKESRNGSGNSKFYGVTAGIDFFKAENETYSFETNLFKSGFDPVTGANNNDTYKSVMYKINFSRKF